MASKIKGRIWAAYVACERLCDSDRDASEWLRRSFDSACAAEKQHRATGKRFTNGAETYKLPVADAARYFAVRWFLDTERGGPGLAGRPLTSFADACSIREDALYGLGARDAICGRIDHRSAHKLTAWQKLREEYADVLALDYSEVFVA